MSFCLSRRIKMRKPTSRFKVPSPTLLAALLLLLLPLRLQRLFQIKHTDKRWLLWLHVEAIVELGDFRHINLITSRTQSRNLFQHSELFCSCVHAEPLWGFFHFGENYQKLVNINSISDETDRRQTSRPPQLRGVVSLVW